MNLTENTELIAVEVELPHIFKEHWEKNNYNPHYYDIPLGFWKTGNGELNACKDVGVEIFENSDGKEWVRFKQAIELLGTAHDFLNSPDAESRCREWCKVRPSGNYEEYMLNGVGCDAKSSFISALESMGVKPESYSKYILIIKQKEK